MNPQAADFMRVILANPADDTARLVFADWLDEIAGEPTARAEFIRVQCRIPHLLAEVYELREYDRNRSKQQKELINLRVWERTTLRSHWDDWCSLAKPDRPYSFSQPLSYLVEVIHGDGPHMRIIFSRGFVSEVQLPAEQFLQVADALVWNEEMTDEDRCSCRMYGRDGYVLSFKGKWDKCIACDGTGRIPRPMPDGAQPIERVKLTTRPTDLEMRIMAVEVGLDWRPSHELGDWIRVLKAKFGSGIEFELP